MHTAPCSLADAEPRQLRGLGPGDQAPEQRTDDALAFSADHDVDPGEETMERLAHDAVAVRAAEDDLEIGARALSSRARTSEGTVCWKQTEKPTAFGW